MKTLNGYSKERYTNDYMLLAGYGTKSISDFLLKSGGTMTGSLTVPSISVTGAATFSLAINGSILGNAATASRLQNARTISLTGNVTGSGTFDGSGNLSIATSVNNINATTIAVNTPGGSTDDLYNILFHSGNSLYTSPAKVGRLTGRITCGNLSCGSLTASSIISLANNTSLGFKDTTDTYKNCLTLNTNNDFAIGYGTSGAGYNTYLDGNNIYMRVGTSHAIAVTIDINGLFTFKASQYNETTTLAETSAVLNLNNSNIKGVNGIYFSDISNEINEGIHFVRSGNSVDTLTSYEGTLYYRRNRALGTTKSDASTLSSNVILHNGNISNYQRYHNTYYTTSSNGTAGTSSIASTLNASTYTGYVNGYWLGNLDYVGAMCTSDMANASNTGKYNFVKTGDADTFIYDSSATVQLIIGSRGTNEIIDIYNLQGATLRIFVVNTYNDTRCSVYVIDGDTRTIFDGEDYSTSIAGNVKYWKYGSASYTQLTGISTYFASNTRGILRVIWESGGKIFLIKCSAFPN